MEAPTILRPLDPQDDPDTYPAHEEDDVPEIVVHHDIAKYLDDALAVHVRDGWVTGNVCCYWIRDDRQRYLAPDVFGVEGERPEPAPSCYLKWVHGVLRLAIEIGSRSSCREDEGPKLTRYAEGLQPREYLYYNPANDDLRLFRWVERGYIQVEAEASGRVWSESVQASFGVEAPGCLRAYDHDGRPLRRHEEEVARRAEAEERAHVETARRAEAEEQARVESARRAEAEEQAQVESARRAEAERRLAELEAELARLRNGPGGTRGGGRSN